MGIYHTTFPPLTVVVSEDGVADDGGPPTPIDEHRLCGAAEVAVVKIECAFA